MDTTYSLVLTENPVAGGDATPGALGELETSVPSAAPPLQGYLVLGPVLIATDYSAYRDIYAS